MTALGFALRLYGLADQSLWMDEVLSAVSAGRPFARILLDPSVDQNFPPLHNLLVHASIWCSEAVRPDSGFPR